MTATSVGFRRLSDIIAVLEALYPPDSAEEWDQVGLVCGEPETEVARILFTVDAVPEVVQQAKDTGADLIIAHHPLLLRSIHAVDVAHPKGRMLTHLIKSDIALYVAHTNADIPAGGVVDSLAQAIGLTRSTPLSASSRTSVPLDKIITFVPEDQAQLVIDALAEAGAGAIGNYDRCAFTVQGTGTFRPLTGAHPYLGTAGEVEKVTEQRIEMVLPRQRRTPVVAALLAAHPYETPAWDLFELAPVQSEAGMGRIGTLRTPMPLRDFARQVASAIPATATGVRIAGDADRIITTVAVQAGAGDDLLDRARALGADVYVTSDLRHHPASEALAWPDAPALLEIAHWAAEWTWLPTVERLLRQSLTGRLDQIETQVSTICTDPWTAVITAG